MAPFFLQTREFLDACLRAFYLNSSLTDIKVELAFIECCLLAVNFTFERGDDVVL